MSEALKSSSYKDLFSAQSADYSRFRPTYPEALFRYLSSQVVEHAVAWDCGTGNGQAALRLVDYFDHVIATDPSQNQLDNTIYHDRIEYRVGTGEKSDISNRSINLVTVAQAFHWIKKEEFFSEVKRVVKPGGVLGIWCYGLTQVDPKVDEVVHQFYYDILGQYWEKERREVEEGYQNVRFPFPKILSPNFDMNARWSLEHFVGYLGTWSALQTFIKKNGYNPLETLFPELKAKWGENSEKKVTWKMTLHALRIS